MPAFDLRASDVGVCPGQALARVVIREFETEHSLASSSRVCPPVRWISRAAENSSTSSFPSRRESNSVAASSRAPSAASYAPSPFVERNSIGIGLAVGVSTLADQRSVSAWKSCAPIDMSAGAAARSGWKPLPPTSVRMASSWATPRASRRPGPTQHVPRRVLERRCSGCFALKSSKARTSAGTTYS